MTSNIKRTLHGDTKIINWKDAGLLFPSLVTGIIRTVKKNMIIYKLGALTPRDFQKTQKNIKKAMEL